MTVAKSIESNCYTLLLAIWCLGGLNTFGRDAHEYIIQWLMANVHASISANRGDMDGEKV